MPQDPLSERTEESADGVAHLELLLGGTIGKEMENMIALLNTKRDLLLAEIGKIEDAVTALKEVL